MDQRIQDQQKLGGKEYLLQERNKKNETRKPKSKIREIVRQFHAKIITRYCF